MIDKNTINVSYDDDLDNQFSTTVNQPAHDDWVGLPFDDTPLPSVNADDLADFDDEPNCFDGTTPEESKVQRKLTLILSLTWVLIPKLPLTLYAETKKCQSKKYRISHLKRQK